MQNHDLFGEPIIVNELLRDMFLEPPFSVLDTRQENWLSRKRKWKALGMQSEVGRYGNLLYQGEASKFDGYRVKEGKAKQTDTQSTSIFDPALCELIYNWFCPRGGEILDPFAGGSVRGIVANYLGYKYTGIDIRQEQIDSNIEQAQRIIPDNIPKWVCGDSLNILNKTVFLTQALNKKEVFDMVFSCPPYHDLEKYSDIPDDLSNMTYKDFLIHYRNIIDKSLSLLKEDSFAVFVVGEIRNKKGFYRNFVGHTKNAFIKSGAKLYNDAILLNVVGSASMRAAKVFSAGKKLTKIHQNVLIFYKGNPKNIKLRHKT